MGAFRATTDNFNAPEIAGFNLNGVRHVVDLPLSGPTWQTLPLYVGFEAMIMLEDTNLDDPYSFYAEAHFGDTAKLAGIVIIDANGNPIPGATISADSGQQYPASPIPEPGTHALLFAGLTLLGWQARPRKQQIA